MLKKHELSNYAKGLTKIFIDRIFEEYQTFEGEMDYKTFLDFVLAMENKKSPQALQYFWRVLDIYHKGAIDTFVINMFFRSVITKLETRVQTDYKIDDLGRVVGHGKACQSVLHHAARLDKLWCRRHYSRHTNRRTGILRV